MTTSLTQDGDRLGRVLDAHGLDFVFLGTHDGPRLRCLVEKSSVESQYLRFHHATGRHVPAALTRQLAQLDGVTAFSMGLADHGGELIAECRLICGSDRTAEFGLLVRDDHQHRGLGTALVGVLLRYAALPGVSALHADVLACNKRILEVLARVGPLTAGPVTDGICRVSLAVDPAGI